MATTTSLVPRLLCLALAGLLSLAAVAPLAVYAQQPGDLSVGGQATVAYTGGAGVLLRDAPSYDGAVLQSLPDGTTVDLTNGPAYDAGGSMWYGVIAWGMDGFLPGWTLASVGSAPTGGSETSNPTQDQDMMTDTLDTALAAQDVPDTTESLQPGTALITNTNNDGVRCRVDATYASDVIAVVPEGTVVSIADAAIDVWQPIWCEDTYGFVHTDFVTYADADSSKMPADNAAPVEIPVPSDPGTEDESIAPVEGASPSESAELETSSLSASELSASAVVGYSTVVGTNGQGLRCRSGADYGASTITVLPEGSSVGLRGAVQGEWQPVICGGTNGFAHVSFLSTAGNDAAPSSPVGGPDAPESGFAMVAGTSGGGLNCRASASYSANVITVLAEGSSVALRGAAQGEWQPVTCGGMGGYVFAAFIQSGGSGVAPSSNPAPQQPSNPGGSSTGMATIVNTNGGGLNCRSSAGYGGSVLMVMPEGSSVELLGAAQSEWQPVRCGSQSGFAHVDFLAIRGESQTPANPAPPQSSTPAQPAAPQPPEPVVNQPVPVAPGLAVGSNAKVQASLNLRYSASFSSGVAAVAPAGTVVVIRSGLSNGFYQIDWDGLGGWMYAEYLQATSETASVRGGSAPAPANPAPAPSQPAAPSNSSGSSIVSYAMQYVGYPYVWAGAGPYGFDCSGFTLWVAKNVLGKNITHDMFTQIAMGAPVGRGELQLGDFIYFQNTFKWGLSHAGIYIGNGQFVHAENENTGVRVSDLNSDYYSSRWYGAVRYN